MKAVPFEIKVPQFTLDDLKDRLARTRWPDEIEDSGWAYAVNLAYLKELVDYRPREWAERTFNMQRFTRMPRGGHFAALEAPEILADDIRAFFRTLR